MTTQAHGHRPHSSIDSPVALLALLSLTALSLSATPALAADPPKPTAPQQAAPSPSPKAAPPPSQQAAPPQKAGAPAPAVSFLKDVAPIFVKNCVVCHGAKSPKGRYNMSTFDGLTKGGEQGDDIAPGKPDESTLVDLLKEPDPAVRMPKDADPLSPDQIALIERWIKEGAKFDGPSPTADLATLIPKPPHPMPPDKYRFPMPVTALAFAPDGKSLAVSGYHEILIYDTGDLPASPPPAGKEVPNLKSPPKLLRRLTNIAERTYAMAYSPDGKILATASGTPGQLGEVKLWNPADGKMTKDLFTASDSIYALTFSPDGKRLAAGGADRAIRIWETDPAKLLKTMEDHADWVLGLRYTPDGKHLISASRDKTCKVFDAEKGESQVTYPNHTDWVYSIAVSPDGKQAASAGRDKTIRLWNPADGKNIRDIGGHSGEVFSLIFLPKGDALLSSSADKSLRLSNPADAKNIRALTGHTDWVYSLALSPDAKYAASAAWDGDLRIWDIATGTLLRQFLAAPGYPPTTTAQASK